METLIERFRGKYAFLSNFYPASIEYGGRKYSTSEHAYQAAKAVDESDRIYIATAPTPGEAKRRGHKIHTRLDWPVIRINVMALILKAKFDQNPELKRQLLETEPLKIAEGNDWLDDFWGIYKGKGANWLGELLMSLRDYYLGKPAWITARWK